MAGTRKLGKPTDQRLAMLKVQTTDLLVNGKIVTTEARAKEVKAIVDSVIALAVKEYKNFEEVEVKVVKAKLDNNGRKVTEKVTSKNGKEYLRVVKEEKTEKRQKDMPSRLSARRKLMTKVNKVEGVDLMDKLFNELAPKYEGRVGGYTRILKMEPRRGDNSSQAILMLV
ncbi:MAG: 50S ribosomal protein L17 [Clostridia bacterium]|nr:50S ribosomal protein L17 [Clostridia bacterium]